MIKRDLKDNFQISISGQDTWYDMNVPGSAMDTFCKEGILPDPYYGMNEYKWTEFWKNDFDIRMHFFCKRRRDCQRRDSSYLLRKLIL